jgi:hypothetical protein
MVVLMALLVVVVCGPCRDTYRDVTKRNGFPARQARGNAAVVVRESGRGQGVRRAIGAT